MLGLDRSLGTVREARRRAHDEAFGAHVGDLKTWWQPPWRLRPTDSRRWLA